MSDSGQSGFGHAPRRLHPRSAHLFARSLGRFVHDLAGSSQVRSKPATTDLPPNFPMYILDIRQVMHERGIRKSDMPPKPKDAHSAIADARWHRAMHEAILAL